METNIAIAMKLFLSMLIGMWKFARAVERWWLLPSILMLWVTVADAQVYPLSLTKKTCQQFGCTSTSLHYSAVCIGRDEYGQAVFASAGHDMLTTNGTPSVLIGQRSYAARIIYSAKDQNTDLSLLVCKTDETLLCAAINKDFPPIGTPVRMLTYPGRIGMPKLKVDNKQKITSQIQYGYFNISGLTCQGESGGGVFDEGGKLIGIVVFANADPARWGSHSGCTPASHILSSYEKCYGAGKAPKIEPEIAPLPPTEPPTKPVEPGPQPATDQIPSPYLPKLQPIPDPEISGIKADLSEVKSTSEENKSKLDDLGTKIGGVHDLIEKHKSQVPPSILPHVERLERGAALAEKAAKIASGAAKVATWVGIGGTGVGAVGLGAMGIGWLLKRRRAKKAAKAQAQQPPQVWMPPPVAASQPPPPQVWVPPNPIRTPAMTTIVGPDDQPVQVRAPYIQQPPPPKPEPADDSVPRQYIEIPVERETEIYRQAMDRIHKSEDGRNPSFTRYHKLLETHYNLIKSGREAGGA